MPTHPALLQQAFKERLGAAMRIPAVEALFPAPWSAAARRVLPSPSPQLTATAMWGPVSAWCALELLAESIDAQNPGRAALDLFDRLRLRESFAHAFNALGFEDEASWRAAARIRVVLLAGAGVREPEPEVAPLSEPADADAEKSGTRPTSTKAETETGLPVDRVDYEVAEERVALAPELWADADVRWLTGVHEAEGHSYLVREPYEELLWWLLMPALLRLAGETIPNRTTAQKMRRTVEEALTTAAAANYRVDVLSQREEDGAPDLEEPEGYDTKAAGIIEAERVPPKA